MTASSDLLAALLAAGMDNFHLRDGRVAWGSEGPHAHRPSPDLFREDGAVQNFHREVIGAVRRLEYVDDYDRVMELWTAFVLEPVPLAVEVASPDAGILWVLEQSRAAREEEQPREVAGVGPEQILRGRQ